MFDDADKCSRICQIANEMKSHHGFKTFLRQRLSTSSHHGQDARDKVNTLLTSCYGLQLSEVDTRAWAAYKTTKRKVQQRSRRKGTREPLPEEPQVPSKHVYVTIKVPADPKTKSTCSNNLTWLWSFEEVERHRQRFQARLRGPIIVNIPAFTKKKPKKQKRKRR